MLFEMLEQITEGQERAERPQKYQETSLSDLFVRHFFYEPHRLNSFLRSNESISQSCKSERESNYHLKQQGSKPTNQQNGPHDFSLTSSLLLSFFLLLELSPPPKERRMNQKRHAGFTTDRELLWKDLRCQSDGRGDVAGTGAFWTHLPWAKPLGCSHCSAPSSGGSRAADLLQLPPHTCHGQSLFVLL